MMPPETSISSSTDTSAGTSTGTSTGTSASTGTYEPSSTTLVNGTTTTTDGGPPTDGANIGAIVGGVLGGMVLLIILSWFICKLRCCKKCLNRENVHRMRRKETWAKFVPSRMKSRSTSVSREKNPDSLHAPQPSENSYETRPEVNPSYQPDEPQPSSPPPDPHNPSQGYSYTYDHWPQLPEPAVGEPSPPVEEVDVSDNNSTNSYENQEIIEQLAEQHKNQYVNVPSETHCHPLPPGPPPNEGDDLYENEEFLKEVIRSNSEKSENEAPYIPHEEALSMSGVHPPSLEYIPVADALEESEKLARKERAVQNQQNDKYINHDSALKMAAQHRHQ